MDVVGTAKFLQLVQDIVNDDLSKSTRAIAKQLEATESILRLLGHENFRYRSYVMRRGHFMSQKTEENRHPINRLLNKLKHPQEPDMLWLFSDEKNFD